jgi:hypothetical protein
MSNIIKHELHDIISGKSKISDGTIIQTISNYLRECEKTSGIFKTEKHFKKQETTWLETFATKNKLWFTEFDFSNYISEGAEQKVYLKDDKFVYKLNDAIYYESWLDYFNNLQLHNYFFPDTSYKLLGFLIENEIIYAVVEQKFIKVTTPTNIDFVKKFMRSNGFKNVRNNDYKNDEIGIIIEDLHDENVLTNHGILYFIDTVFYLTDEFWKVKEL